MITFLYDKNNVLISDMINSAIANVDIIQIKNRLIDGSYHIQTIGDALTIFDIVCYVDEIGKNRIDHIFVTNEPVKLVKRDKYYNGIIDNLSGWSVFAKGDIYTTKFQLIVGGEGMV